MHLIWISSLLFSIAARPLGEQQIQLENKLTILHTNGE